MHHKINIMAIDVFDSTWYLPLLHDIYYLIMDQNRHLQNYDINTDTVWFMDNLAKGANELMQEEV